MLVPSLLDALLDRFLEEDLSGGDLTTEACVDPATDASANVVAKKHLVACGDFVFRRVFERLDASVVFEPFVLEGQAVAPGTIMWRVHGKAAILLNGERTALNLVQRMSGIATVTRRYVDALPEGSNTRITDTRKTTPGLRPLERYAVRTGGAYNHRDNLGSAVLIKDNHIVAAGSVTAAIARAKSRAPHTSRIEVEVDSLLQLDEALTARADIVLLDNFSLPDVHEAVTRVRRMASRRPLVEVSGGITLERIPELAAAGVDIISVGALTHSAPAADISLDLWI